MAAIRDAFNQTYRDFVTDGVPASGANKPRKSDIRALGTLVDEAMQGAAEGLVQVATWSELSARAGARAGQPGRVMTGSATHVDPITGETVTHAGEYSWSASPAGWRRVGDLARKLGPTSVETGDLQVGAVLPSRLAGRDFSNIYPDSDMVDASLYSGLPFSLSTTSAAVPNSRYLNCLTTPEAGSIHTPSWPVEAGQLYLFSALIGRQGGEVGVSVTATLGVEFFSDHAMTTLVETVAIGTYTGVGLSQRRATFNTPAGACRARYKLSKEVDGGTRLAMSSPIVRRIVERPYYDPAKHPATLFKDGTDGSIYDFTASVGSVGAAVAEVADYMDRNRLYVPSLNTPPKGQLRNGRMTLVTGDVMDMFYSSTPLLPEEGDFMLAWNHLSETNGAKAFLWQSASGELGRLQLTANARYNGSSTPNVDGRLQLILGGVTDGSGPNGAPVSAAHPVGEWADFVLIIRDGEKACEFRRNGELVDSFTRPPVIYQTTTSIFRNASFANSQTTGQAMNRMVCLHRAPAAGEVDFLRAWLSEGFTSQQSAKDSDNEFSPPDISAASAVVRVKSMADFIEPTELWGKAPTEVLRPASMTKLMSAYVGLNWLKKLDAEGVIDMDTLTGTCHAGDATGGTGNNLNSSDVLDVRNLLANMGLPSSNVATVVFARTVGELILSYESSAGDGYARFIAEMNAEAALLGMANSVWVEAHGLDKDGHVSTAHDMSLLCEAAASTHPEICDIWGRATWQLAITGPSARTIALTHSLDFIENGDPRIVWGKTGTTNLGKNCILCEVRGPLGNRYFYVGLASDSDGQRYADADAVFDAVNKGAAWPVLQPTLRG